MESATIEQRNFVLNVVEGALFAASTAFISGQTVLPAMVSALGGGNIAVGSLVVIQWVALFLPQIFAARYVEMRPWKKPWSVMFGTIQRCVVLVMGCTVLIFGSSSPGLAIGLFLVLFFCNQFLMGITTPGWFDMFAKMTPATRRGRLVGFRNSVGGAASFACGLVLIWILSEFSIPLSFALAFFCAFFLQISSILVQTQLVEEHPSAISEPKPFAAFLRRLPDVFLQNPEFRRFVVAVGFLVCAVMPMGFFTVYALKRFQGGESMVGQFTLLMVAVQVVSGLVNGYIADRYGNKTVLVIAALALLCASIWALLAPTLDWFRLVFVFVGINLGSEIMARYNMSIEYGPVEQRSTYVGLMNTVIAPFYLSGMIGGVLSDLFGYEAVFVTGIGFSVIGVLLLVCTVHDPRRMFAQA